MVAMTATMRAIQLSSIPRSSATNGSAIRVTSGAIQLTLVMIPVGGPPKNGWVSTASRLGDQTAKATMRAG
jgi:hypothetical protein